MPVAGGGAVPWEVFGRIFAAAVIPGKVNAVFPVLSTVFSVALLCLAFPVMETASPQPVLQSEILFLSEKNIVYGFGSAAFQQQDAIGTVAGDGRLWNGNVLYLAVGE